MDAFLKVKRWMYYMKQASHSTRLHLFPALHPGACFYDILARYHVQSAHLTFRATTRELFAGNPDLRVAITLPYRANLVYEWLGPASNITVEMLRDRHSAWQYLQLCGRITETDLQPVIQAETRPGRRKQSRMISMLQDGLPSMRYCPLCILKDKLTVREPYWHQVHQLYGVKYCPEHGTPLQNAEPSLTRRLGRYVTAEEILAASSLEAMARDGTTSQTEARLHDPYYKEYCLLAQTIAWLLENALSLGSFSDVDRLYKQDMGKADDTQFTGAELLDFVTQTWSMEFLQDLRDPGCAVM